MIIGIIGYFTVPSVANYIVHAGGGGALGQKVTSLFSGSTASAVNTVTQGASMVMDAMGNADSRMNRDMASTAGAAPYFKDGNSYMGDKLKGNSK
ncbi:MAG: hypothetical protein EOO20_04860 [Chryseobacterium sp.]|nr:MAG: hypothetical protein EOO20_04860 [Chryseobacterium sp.]